MVDRVVTDLAGGRIEAVALTAGPGESVPTLADQARAAVGVGDGDAVQVLRGNSRARAEPDPDADRRETAIALLSATTGLAAFVSIFVVSGTFTYAVDARRREFGLLRAAGTTPRQVFRLVLGEALVVGVLAAAVGGALGAMLAPRFARWLAGTGFTPSDFTARFVFWPVAAAFGVGLVVALLGAWLAARRAGRVAPIAALREAAVDPRPMTLARVVVGLAALGGCVPMLVAMSAVHSSDAIALVLLSAMLLVVACAMFAPLVVPPVVRLLTAPLAASSGGVVLLARHSAVTAVRRTAATAAPVLVTVGIASATLTGFGTLQAATQSAAHDRITADAVAVPGGGAGLADPTVARLRAVPGVAAAIPVTEDPVYVSAGGEPEEWTGRYATGADLATVLDLPVVDGNLADLTGTATIAVPAGRWKLGDTAEIWLGDATPVRLRVVAVFDRQLDLDETVLLPWDLRRGHASQVADTVYLRFAADSVVTAGG
ncbi:ABC transporter permease, partial [Frankia sp. CpI1-P]